MRRQSAWVLVVFGWSRDVDAAGVDCSGVGRVPRIQQRPPGGCRSWPIRHRTVLRLSRVPWKLRWRSPARFLPCGRCRASAKTHQLKKGTVMKKSSQGRAGDASVIAMPEQVSVAMAEIAENMSEGLLAL